MSKMMVSCDMHEDDTPAKAVSFGLDGKTYKIDLCEADAQQLRSALRPFVDAAQGASGTGEGSARAPKATAAKRIPARTRQAITNTSEIRAWAIQNGWNLGDRGRIPKQVLDDYKTHAPRTR